MKTKRTRLFLAIGLLFCIAAMLIGCSTGDLASILGGGGGGFVAFTTGQAANVVIGEPDFTTSTGGTTASLIAGSYSSPFVASDGTLILPDEGSNRTLIFNSVPTTNGASANYALQQLDLTSSSGGVSATKTSCPEQAIIANGKMIQADYCNNRVIIYNSGIPGSSPGTIDVVVGQTDKTSTTSTCDAIHMDSVESVAVANGKLIVTDGDHNRILIWNTIPTADGTPADLVLGQPNMTSCAANQGGAVAANTLSYPNGMWTNGTKLVVEDAENNRVLIWNSIPTSTDQPADLVLGQPNMTSSASGTSATTMDYPYDGVFFTNSQLFITDCDNSRVLIWNSFPTTNGQAADVVLGQPNFTSSASGTSATTFDCPAGVFLNGTKLIVSDPGNNRYMIFQGH